MPSSSFERYRSDDGIHQPHPYLVVLGTRRGGRTQSLDRILTNIAARSGGD